MSYIHQEYRIPPTRRSPGSTKRLLCLVVTRALIQPATNQWYLLPCRALEPCIASIIPQCLCSPYMHASLKVAVVRASDSLWMMTTGVCMFIRKNLQAAELATSKMCLWQWSGYLPPRLRVPRGHGFAHMFSAENQPPYSQLYLTLCTGDQRGFTRLAGVVAPTGRENRRVEAGATPSEKWLPDCGRPGAL